MPQTVNHHGAEAAPAAPAHHVGNHVGGAGRPVTADNVQAAVAAGCTNAAAVRRHLGRGSLATIQRHLGELRQQAAQVQTDEAPTAQVEPRDDVLKRIWQLAVTEAVADLGEQLAAALRDGYETSKQLAEANARLERAEELIAELQSDLDAALVRAAAAEAQAAEAAAAAAAADRRAALLAATFAEAVGRDGGAAGAKA